jgi:hypothetical protein
VPLVIAAIPVFLLFKKNKFGAFLSIFLGSIDILIIFSWMFAMKTYATMSYPQILGILLSTLPGIFFAAAGIYYFKVESKIKI